MGSQSADHKYPQSGGGKMKSLRNHVVENANAARSEKRRRNREPAGEDMGDVRIVSSLGLDAATVALPAGIDLESRADRMNSFWRALVEFQYRDVLVVAICADDAR
jgi:hypothetical protein